MHGFQVRTAVFVSLALIVGTALLPASQKGSESAEAGIRRTLEAQMQAWNRGDIPGFMDGYLRDESLRFASGGSVRRGWQEALTRYQAAYPTRTEMGMLTFSDLEFFPISDDYVEVFGKFHLAREKAVGDSSGLFTLLMVREGDRWLVLHDHTSSAK